MEPNQPANSQSPQQPPLPKPRHNNSKSIIIILTILLIITTSFAIYFYLQVSPKLVPAAPTDRCTGNRAYWNPQSQTCEVVPPADPDIPHTATPTPQNPSNWQTYTHPQKSFSFKYPPGSLHNESTPDTVRLTS